MPKMPSLIAAATWLALSVLTGQPGWAAPPSKPNKPSQPSEPAASTSPPAPAAGPGQSTSGVVNLNDASSEQLQLLPGVGPSRAEAILSYRKSHPFKRVEELTRIKGIGRKSLLRLRSLLTTSGPTTLKERPGKPESPLAHHRHPATPKLS